MNLTFVAISSFQRLEEMDFSDVSKRYPTEIVSDVPGLENNPSAIHMTFE